MKKLFALIVGIVFLVELSGAAKAQPEALMYTLGDIYDYLIEGEVPIKGGHDFEPPVGAEPGDTQFKSLEQILDDIKAQFELAGASAEDVAEGVPFWSTNSGGWGIQTGEKVVGGGGMISTGQTTSYITGDDGYYQKGKPRDYTANEDGTVTDNVTGLMWPEDANGKGCYTGQTMSYVSALSWSGRLNFAGYSDWRIPNVHEFISLVMMEPSESGAKINKTYFLNSKNNYYWTSTTTLDRSSTAFQVNFSLGRTTTQDKATYFKYYVRVVRDAF